MQCPVLADDESSSCFLSADGLGVSLEAGSQLSVVHCFRGGQRSSPTSSSVSGEGVLTVIDFVVNCGQDCKTCCYTVFDVGFGPWIWLGVLRQRNAHYYYGNIFCGTFVFGAVTFRFVGCDHRRSCACNYL